MKILKTFLAVACCAMMFTACGGSDKADNAAADSTATENAEGAEAKEAEEVKGLPFEGFGLGKDGEDLGAYEYHFDAESHNLTITIKTELAKDVTAYTNINAPYEADDKSITVDYTAATLAMCNLTGDGCSNYPEAKSKANNEKWLEEKKALGKVTYTVEQESESGGKQIFTLTSDKETIKISGYK